MDFSLISEGNFTDMGWGGVAPHFLFVNDPEK
jgi:hypothetical protein